MSMREASRPVVRLVESTSPFAQVVDPSERKTLPPIRNVDLDRPALPKPRVRRGSTMSVIEAIASFGATAYWMAAFVFLYCLLCPLPSYAAEAAVPTDAAPLAIVIGCIILSAMVVSWVIGLLFRGRPSSEIMDDYVLGDLTGWGDQP